MPTWATQGVKAIYLTHTKTLSQKISKQNKNPEPTSVCAWGLTLGEHNMFQAPLPVSQALLFCFVFKSMIDMKVVKPVEISLFLFSFFSLSGSTPGLSLRRPCWSQCTTHSFYGLTHWWVYLLAVGFVEESCADVASKVPRAKQCVSDRESAPAHRSRNSHVGTFLPFVILYLKI